MNDQTRQTPFEVGAKELIGTWKLVELGNRPPSLWEELKVVVAVEW